VTSDSLYFIVFQSVSFNDPVIPHERGQKQMQQAETIPNSYRRPSQNVP